MSAPIPFPRQNKFNEPCKCIEFSQRCCPGARSHRSHSSQLLQASGDREREGAGGFSIFNFYGADAPLPMMDRSNTEEEPESEPRWRWNPKQSLRRNPKRSTTSPQKISTGEIMWTFSGTRNKGFQFSEAPRSRPDGLRTSQPGF